MHELHDGFKVPPEDFKGLFLVALAAVLSLVTWASLEHFFGNLPTQN